MNRELLKDGLGWGLTLWFVGYLLGILLFMFVPQALLGWVITPIGTALAIWVLIKKVKSGPLNYYLIIGVIWAAIAIIFDYLFIVKLFKPADGYYKLDVYLYYILTFTLPLIVGWYKNFKK